MENRKKDAPPSPHGAEKTARLGACSPANLGQKRGRRGVSLFSRQQPFTARRRTRGCGNRRTAAVQAASEHTAQNAKPVLFQAAAHTRTPRASPRCPARFGVSGPGAGAFHYFLGSSRSQRGGGRAGAEIDAQRPCKQQVNTRRRMQSPSFFKQRHTRARREPHRAARHASASPCAPVHGVRAARRRSPSRRGIFTTYSR